MGVKAHWIICMLLFCIPIAGLIAYMSIGHGGEIISACLFSSLPIWNLWKIIRSNDQRISEKLKDIK